MSASSQTLTLFEHLVKIKEIYTNEYGVVKSRSKYIHRARYVLYRQFIFKPPPKLIIDKTDLPKKILINEHKDLLVREAVSLIFMYINKDVYDYAKDMIKVEVR